MIGIGILTRTRRKFLVGLNTGYTTDGEPDTRLVDFYARRSTPSLYCAIVGNVVIPGGYAGNDHTPTITASSIWTTVAREISQRGTLPGIQLATAWRNYVGQTRFRSNNSARVIAGARRFASQISEQGVRDFFQSLDEGTVLAVDAGFVHVQLHAAHGYLFSLLIDKRIFDGADDVLARVADWALKWSDAGVETSIRFSLRTGDQSFDAKGTEFFQSRIASLPVHYVDVSSGFYNIDKRLIYPGRSDTLAARRAETLALADKNEGASFIYSGRALLRSQPELPPNVHVGLCRDLIANPDYLSDRSRGCKNSGKCHYYSRGASNITCPRWNESFSGVPDQQPKLDGSTENIYTSRKSGAQPA